MLLIFISLGCSMAISFPLGTLVDIFYQIGDTVKQVKGTITSFDDNFVQIKSEDSKDLKKIKISTILEFTEMSNNFKQETEDKNCNNNVENQKTKILEKIKLAFEYYEENYDYVGKLFFSYFSTFPPIYPTKYWDKNDIKINFNIKKILENINTIIVDRQIDKSLNTSIDLQITSSIANSTSLFDCIDQIVQKIQQATKLGKFNSENEFLHETYQKLYKINTILDLEILQELLGLLAINLNVYIKTNGYQHLRNSHLINLANTITAINKKDTSVALVNMLNLQKYDTYRDSKLKLCNIIEIIKFIRFTRTKEKLIRYIYILTNNDFLKEINLFFKSLSFIFKKKTTENFIPFHLIEELHKLNYELINKLKIKESYYPRKKLRFKQNKIIKNNYIKKIISQYSLDDNVFDYKFSSCISDKSILNNEQDINYLWEIFNIAKNKKANDLFDVLSMILNEFSITFEEIFGYTHENPYQLFDNHILHIHNLINNKLINDDKIDLTSDDYFTILYKFTKENKDFINDIFNQIENQSQKIQSYFIKYFLAFNNENLKEEYIDKYYYLEKKLNKYDMSYLFSKLDSDFKAEFFNTLYECDIQLYPYLDQSKLSFNEISIYYQRYLYRNNQLRLFYNTTNKLVKKIKNQCSSFYHYDIILQYIQQYFHQNLCIDNTIIIFLINIFYLNIINYTNVNHFYYNFNNLSIILENSHLYDFVKKQVFNFISYLEQFFHDEKIIFYIYIETTNFLDIFCNHVYDFNENCIFYKKTIENLNKCLDLFPNPHDIERLIILEKLTKYSALLCDENEYIKNSNSFLNILNSTSIKLSNKCIDVFLVDFLNIALYRYKYKNDITTLPTVLDICRKKNLFKYLKTKNETLIQFSNLQNINKNNLSLFIRNTQFYIYWIILKGNLQSIGSHVNNINSYQPYNIDKILKENIKYLEKGNNESSIITISKIIENITPLIISIYKKGPYRYILTLFFRAITDNKTLKLISLDINSIKKQEYKEYLLIISDYISELLSENILSKKYFRLNQELKDFVKSKNNFNSIIDQFFSKIRDIKKLDQDFVTKLNTNDLIGDDKKIINSILNSYLILSDSYEKSTKNEDKIISLYDFINDIHNLIEEENNSTFIFRKIIPFLNETKEIYLSKINTLLNDNKLIPSITISTNCSYNNNNSIIISLTLKEYKLIKGITLYNLDSSHKDINNIVLYEQLPFKIINNYTDEESSTLILNVKPPSIPNNFNLLVKYYYFDVLGRRYDIKIKKQIILKTQEFKPINNPYITGKPVINDALFFGRDDIVYTLSQSLLNDTSNCIVIYGQKRSGKTSIFKHVKKYIDSKFVVLDINVSTYTTELQIYQAIKISFEEFLEDYENIDNLKTFEQIEISDYTSFKRYITKASKLIQKSEKQILLMMDEFTSVFEYIKDPSNDFDSTFMKKLKDLIELELFKIAVIGQHSMLEFIKTYPNEFSVTTPVYVNYLAYNDAVNLIRKPIYNNGENRFVENTCHYIAELFNGQPYYIQIFCSELVNLINSELKQDEINLAFVQYHLSNFIKSKRKDFFDPLILSKDTKTFELLTRLSKNSKIFEEIKLDEISITENEKVTLRKLHENKVIKFSDNSHSIKFIIPFFQMWLKEQ